MKIYKIKLNNKVYEVEVEVSENNERISIPKEEFVPKDIKDDDNITAESKEQSAVILDDKVEGLKIEVPMPGTILDLRVTVGQNIKEGDIVAVLEAMKMENEIVSPVSGIVQGVGVSKGDAVNVGELIAVIK